MSYIFLIPAFIYAAWSDLKNRTIPIWLFPGTMVFIFIYNFFTGKSVDLWNLIGFSCMFVPTMLAGMAGVLGGADIIMFSITGAILGKLTVSYVVILASLSTLFFLFSGLKNRTYPMAPFAMAAFIIFFVWRVIYVYY